MYKELFSSKFKTVWFGIKLTNCYSMRRFLFFMTANLCLATLLYGCTFSSVAHDEQYGYNAAAKKTTNGIFTSYTYAGATSPFQVKNLKNSAWQTSGLVNAPIKVIGEDTIRNDDGGYQFTDRSNTDGMGYVILKKNSSFADQVTTQGTIYEIRYFFDLRGATVTIPAGCVLKFNGGMLSNGKLNGSATIIENKSNAQIFNRTLDFTGSWNNQYSSIGWFVDNNYSKAFAKAIKISYNIYVPAGRYVLEDGLSINKSINIFGDGLENTRLLLREPVTISGSLGSQIEGICFTMDSEAEHLDCFVRIINSFDIHLLRCGFYGNNSVDVGVLMDAVSYDQHSYFHTIAFCRFTALPIGVKCTRHSNSNTIDNNEFYACVNCIVIDSCNGERIINNTFQSFTGAGVKFEFHKFSNAGSITRGNLVEGNYFEGVNQESTVGDIDFTNNDNCNSNYVLGNNMTVISSSKKHVMNMSAGNMILESTRNTLNRANLLTGFNRFEPLSFNLSDYTGDEFVGTIVPVITNNGNQVDFYVGTKINGSFSWRKLPVLNPDGSFSAPNTFFSFASFGYGDTLQLPINSNVGSRHLCYERWRDLLKYGNYDGDGWWYIQRIESGAKRPDGGGYLPPGFMFFDTKLTPPRPIWWTGSEWVDATGAKV